MKTLSLARLRHAGSCGNQQFPADWHDIEADGKRQKKKPSLFWLNKQSEEQNNFSTALIFVMASLVVSLLTHKIAHMFLDSTNGGLNMASMENYHWILSIFLSDIIFLAVTYCILYCLSMQKSPHGTNAANVFGGALCMLAFLISSIEIQSLLSFKEAFPWHMMLDFIKQWENSRAFSKAAAKEEGFVPIWTVWGIQILLTTTLFKAAKNGLTASSRWWMKLNIKKMLGILLILVFLRIQVWIYRPGIPYDHFSHTPLMSVPRDLAPGFFALWPVQSSLNTTVHLEEKKMTAQAHDPVLMSHEQGSAVPPIQHDSFSSPSKKNINVVLLILESTRADLMPYANSTSWAKQNGLDKVSAKEVTPFFNNLVNDKYSLHIPHIKGGSGITIKALFNLFCSMHSLSTKLTYEHGSKFYHQCLPQVLKKAGYYHQLFAQSSKIVFDHEDEVIAKSGFNDTYSFESYLKENDVEEYSLKRHIPKSNKTMWVDSHKTNPVTLEDDVFLDPVLRWVDNATASNTTPTIGGPFFLSYLTGVTHWPYRNAPGADWEHKSFVRNRGLNNLLNAVAYEDRFISNVFLEFEKRNLMNSTLFVITGDHGANFLNRHRGFTTVNQYNEEMFDVGVTFHTQNKELAEELNKLSGTVRSKTWATIDIMPTILDLLGLQGSYKADGWSMMNPRRDGRRMTYSTSNPGTRMILRDGDFIIVAPNKEEKARNTLAEVVDLSKDPDQHNPIFLEQVFLNEKAFDKIDDSERYLVQWGVKARSFLEMFEEDLLEAHRNGQRCYSNCSLSLLDSLESLEDWDGFKEGRV